MISAGDGGKGGGGSMPYQGEAGQMMYGALANRMARSDPAMAAMFGARGPQAEAYKQAFGGNVPPTYTGFGTIPKAGDLTQAAMQGVYGTGNYKPATKVASLNPTSSSKFKGAGSYVNVPTGQPNQMQNMMKKMASDAAQKYQASSMQMPGQMPVPQGAGKDGGQDVNGAKSLNMPTAYMKGAGAMSEVPTGEPMAAPEYNPAQMQTKTVTTPTTQAVTPYDVNPQQYKLMQGVGMETIKSGAKADMSNLLKQMGARGMGQSGLAMQGAINQYNRGAGQQASQFGRQLSSDYMGNQFQAGMQGKQLEAARQLGQGSMDLQAQQLDLQQRFQAAGLSQAEAAKRAEIEMANRQQNVATALGIGNLGISERGQGLAELTAQRQWEDAPLSALAGLGQSAMAASAGGGGKGGGK